ncbi:MULTISPECIES: DMT family transporter [unclassified Streptomyces]|uniref:DMT family transporter n=1 Tax=unclassified Streptomyces TaxID=2593676 RepID=UPI001BEAA277|nr:MULTISPECIES: EamA family transporter [unclassified Streptomyces]MBT2406041.1 EamA family transporter [Streptomyces sp. ISL-21]MBT2610643.1 EamA family transporter [Streptomyces sp. ISL-87]
MDQRRDRVAPACFVAGSVLAGGNAVGIRLCVRELDSLWGAALRFGAAAVVLFAVMAVLRLPWPRGKALGGAVAFGLLNFGVTFALTYYALVEIHAGLGQTMLALVPLVTLMLSVLQGQERFRATAVAGTLLAVAGVAVISQATLRGSVPLLSFLALLGSVLSFAQAAVMVQRLPRVHPVAMNAVGMAAGAVALFAGSLIAGYRWVLPERATTWWALAYLVVAGSVLTFVFYLLVIQHWGASRAAYAFVVVPVVAIMASAWLDDEPLTAALLLGTPLILAGVYLGALRRTRPAPRAPVSPPGGRPPRTG